MSTLPSVSVYRLWRVYIDDVEYTYLDLSFTQTHPSSFPDTFTITLDGEHNIASFAVVEIEKDGVLRFYGYVEGRKWTSNVDTIITGRCRKVITWKKWTERFEEARGEMQGFFGVTHPEEVFRFILRCPISDVPTEEEEWRDYPHQKIGWGMNPDSWTCSASSSSNGTDPIYAKLRLLDFYWRNRGIDSALVTLYPNGTNGPMDWIEIGGAGAGAINNCGNDAIYIRTPDNDDMTYEYDFTNLGGTATGINEVNVYLRIRKGASWFSWGVTLMVEVSPDGGATWMMGGLIVFNHTAWQYHKFNLTHILTTVAEVNNAQIRLTKYAGPPSNIYVSCMYLRVDYSADGTQEIGDMFEVNLGAERERVCGIVVQSRHSPDQYPRDYCIQRYEEDSGEADFTDGAEWTQVDPFGHITIASATHIDHDQYKNEDAYTYNDFGVGQFASYFEHTFRFRTLGALVVDPDDNGPIYIPYMVADTLDDALAVETANDGIMFGAWYRTSAATGPAFFLSGFNSGAVVRDISANGTFADATWYWVRIIKAGTLITAYVYTSEADFLADINRHVTLSTTILGGDITMRYLYAGVTYNTGTAYFVVGDIEIFNTGDWVDIVCDENNTCAQDLVHSWSPIPIERIRIRIAGADATHAWEISQIYIYECDEERFCIMEDA